MNWHLALEHQMDLHKWHSTPIGHKLTEGFFSSLMHLGAEEVGKLGFLEQERERVGQILNGMAQGLVQCLWRADTMYLTRGMQEVILQAAHDLPEEAICLEDHLLLCKTGFMLLEDSICGEDVHGIETRVGAIAWMFDPEAYVISHHSGQNVQGEFRDLVHLYFFEPQGAPYSNEYAELLRSGGVPIPPLQFSHYYPLGRYNEQIGMLVNEENRPGVKMVKELLRMFVATHLVAQQSIGTTERFLAPRATRKRTMKWNPELGNSYISLIQLRKKKAKHSDEPQKVDWSRRWVVSGHWRKQWYPSLGVHQWKYIYEYVKGPEDKPLVVRERRVFNFAR